MALSGIGRPAAALITANGDVHSIPTLPAPDLSGVVRLGNGCSAVLLKGGAHMLGAAHCHEGVGGSVRFPNGAAATITRVALAPGWAGKPGVHDLALMTLDAPIVEATGYSIALPEAVTMPCVVLMAGWGAAGSGATGAEAAPAQASSLRHSYNQYETLLQPVAVYGNRVALFDFDDGDTRHNAFGSSGLAEYEAMLAPQDSGGPSFVAVSGQWQLAGIHVGIVTSKGTGFGGVGLDLRVAPYARWIQGVMRQQVDRSANVVTGAADEVVGIREAIAPSASAP